MAILFGEEVVVGCSDILLTQKLANRLTKSFQKVLKQGVLPRLSGTSLRVFSLGDAVRGQRFPSVVVPCAF